MKLHKVISSPLKSLDDIVNDNNSYYLLSAYYVPSSTLIIFTGLACSIITDIVHEYMIISLLQIWESRCMEVK